MTGTARKYALIGVSVACALALVLLILSLQLGSTSTAIQYTLDSMAYGSLYALMALGLSLLFGVMGLMNFAYGELIMAGAYTMFFTRSWGWLGMILITILIVTILSLLTELVAFRPLRNASPVTLLVASFAVSYALQEFAWTDGLGLAHQFDATIGTGPQKGVEPYPWLTNQFDVSGVLVSKLEIVTVVVTIAVIVGMTVLLKRTMLGIQLRASTEDFRMTQLTGVKANRVISAAFAITGVIAGIVAVLYVFRNNSVAPDMGQGPLFVAFVGGAIGGLGSLTGAALGGFVLGMIINILGATLSIQYKSHTQLFAFLLVIGILVFVPDGLIAFRGSAVARLWAKFRKPAVEGTTP